MNILLFGEKYSDNLGDGVISECLSFAIRVSVKHSAVLPLDLSLRDDYSIGGFASNDSILSNRSSGFIGKMRKVAGWLTLRKKQASLQWAKKIASANVIAIGGGQLFLDRELNFPIKLYVLSRLMKNFQGRIVILSCGVSKVDGVFAKFFFNSLLNHKCVTFVSVRDLESIENMNILNETQDVNLLYDPAFISADCYKLNITKRNVVGINVMDFHTLNRLLEGGEEAEYLQFWLSLIDELRNRGYEVKLFTNGASEDIASMKLLYEKLNKNIEYIIPTSPQMLVETISGFSLVFAHRLHANIIAYANKVPSVGFIWDDKVIGFSKLTEREEYFIHGRYIFDKVNYIVDLGEKAVCHGVDQVKLKSIKKDFYDKLSGALNVERRQD